MRFFILIILFTTVSWSQQPKFVSKTPLKADRFVGKDHFNHLYYIDKGALLKEGDLGSFRFQDFQLGPITTVDLINPMNVVVFYEETATVVFLDNRLNEKERIVFNDLPSFINLSMVANAGNNQLWLFNMENQKLQVYQYRNEQLVTQSLPLAGKIIAHCSDFNRCTLLTENKLYTLNIYGSLVSERPLNGFDGIFKYDEIHLGKKGNSLYWLRPETDEPIELPMVENPIKDLQLTQDFLYIYDGMALYTFTLTQPK